jgi:protein phosphatase
MIANHIDSFGISDIGLVRANNEDVWSQILSIPFFVLADGMGGHQAGEVAAKVAVIKLCQQIDAAFMEQTLYEPKELCATVRESIKNANAFVYELAGQNEDLKGMGTTLCCMILHQNNVIYGHVGDSRVYLLRDTLHPLTVDHSLRSQLIAKGQLDQASAQTFPLKNVITKAIGTTPYVEPDVGFCKAEQGDIFLLCSDGLSDCVSDKQIEKIIKTALNVQEASHQLIETAKKNGGTDNITVVMMKIL